MVAGLPAKSLAGAEPSEPSSSSTPAQADVARDAAKRVKRETLKDASSMTNEESPDRRVKPKLARNDSPSSAASARKQVPSPPPCPPPCSRFTARDKISSAQVGGSDPKRGRGSPSPGARSLALLGVPTHRPGDNPCPRAPPGPTQASGGCFYASRGSGLVTVKGGRVAVWPESQSTTGPGTPIQTNRRLVKVVALSSRGSPLDSLLRPNHGDLFSSRGSVCVVTDSPTEEEGQNQWFLGLGRVPAPTQDRNKG